MTQIAFAPFTRAQEAGQPAQKKDAAERQILAEMKIAKKFIENREWEKARLKLKKTIAAFPREPSSDIAYYWLAYTLYRQKNFSGAEQTINILQHSFPDSAWVNESKLLLAEINSQTGRRLELTNEEFAAGDDESKAFAVQNLLETDRAQAMLKIDEILDPAGSSAGTLKESILILLFDDKSDWATEKFIRIIKTEKNTALLNQALIGLRKRDEQKTLPVLRDFLAVNADERLLDAALYAVSGFSDETAVTVLAGFAKSGGRQELIQKSIIWLGNLGSPGAIGELKALYKSLTETGLKQQIQISLAEINQPASLNILTGLIETETDQFLIEHGLEMLKRKIAPAAFRELLRKLQNEKKYVKKPPQ